MPLIAALFLSIVAAAVTVSACGCCETRGGMLSSCAACPATTTQLHLGNCGLTGILPGAFASLQLDRVASVDLSNNALSTLSVGAFEGLFGLTLLDLSSNLLTAVDTGALSGEVLPLLASLDLGFNELNSVPILLAPNLTSLGLYWNPISYFSDDSFKGVARLQYLDANNCGLTNVSLAAFAPLTALTTLNIGHNSLTELPEGGWRGPSNLTTLALQVNSLAALPPHFFDAFPLLESLPVYGNQLTSLEPGTFAALSNLAGLYLNDNNISSLHVGCFAGLTGSRFQYLSLTNNVLSPTACNANFAAVATIPSACFQRTILV